MHKSTDPSTLRLGFTTVFTTHLSTRDQAPKPNPPKSLTYDAHHHPAHPKSRLVHVVSGEIHCLHCTSRQDRDRVGRGSSMSVRGLPGTGSLFNSEVLVRWCCEEGWVGIGEASMIPVWAPFEQRMTIKRSEWQSNELVDWDVAATSQSSKGQGATLDFECLSQSKELDLVR